MKSTLTSISELPIIWTAFPAHLLAGATNAHFVDSLQGCKRYFPKVSPIIDIDAGFKSIVDTDIDTLL